MAAAMNPWRLTLYREAAGLLNDFCNRFLSPYCLDCSRVIARLPEARDEDFELLDGIYPGCCHRGAGDIFRLEGQLPGRDRLAPELVARLQETREKLLAENGFSPPGGYTIRRLRDGKVLPGTHCRHFSEHGCRLGDLKGPLCLDFVCPPIRSDLLALCEGDDSLVGPENDFLLFYRLLAAISWDPPAAAWAEMEAFQRRLGKLVRHCRDFLRCHVSDSLSEYFDRKSGSGSDRNSKDVISAFDRSDGF